MDWYSVTRFVRIQGAAEEQRLLCFRVDSAGVYGPAMACRYTQCTQGMLSAMDDTQDILRHYGITAAAVEALGEGLINDTYLVRAGDERYVLQRLNAMFAADANLDIDELTRHFAAAGATTLALIPTRDAPPRLWVEQDGRIWRLATYIDGVCVERIESSAAAAAAGELLGRFHLQAAAAGLRLRKQRLGVHDTAGHLQRLREGLELQRGQHRYFPAIETLAAAVLAAAAELPDLPALPDRLVHGDPKISNLIFARDTGVGLCMIDLDTLAYMPLPLELGDAFRSWCNPKGENSQASRFRLDYFEAALTGYADAVGDWVQPAEWQNFVPATRRIMVELAARFTLDALNESYFGWDPEHYADRSTHNQVRAAGQLALHESLCAQLDAAEAIVTRIFSGR